jgi:hypothetical protein
MDLLQEEQEDAQGSLLVWWQVAENDAEELGKSWIAGGSLGEVRFQVVGRRVSRRYCIAQPDGGIRVVGAGDVNDGCILGLGVIDLLANLRDNGVHQGHENGPLRWGEDVGHLGEADGYGSRGGCCHGADCSRRWRFLDMRMSEDREWMPLILSSS